jgi:hypothetical protein
MYQLYGKRQKVGPAAKLLCISIAYRDTIAKRVAFFWDGANKANKDVRKIPTTRCQVEKV